MPSFCIVPIKILNSMTFQWRGAENVQTNFLIDVPTDNTRLNLVLCATMTC